MKDTGRRYRLYNRLRNRFTKEQKNRVSGIEVREEAGQLQP